MRIEVRNGKHKTYIYKEWLKEQGFSFKKTGLYTGVWYKEENNLEEIKQLRRRIKKRRLKLILIDSHYERSNDYRKIFFENNKGTVKKDVFHCAYCGKILRKKDVEVDHIISVYLLSKSKYKHYYQAILSMLGCKNSNQPLNLVATCSSCNRRKSNKGGFWIIRGFLGRYFYFWIIMYVIILMIIFYLFMNIK